MRVDASFDDFVNARSTALLRVARHWSRAQDAPDAYTRKVLVNYVMVWTNTGDVALTEYRDMATGKERQDTYRGDTRLLSLSANLGSTPSEEVIVDYERREWWTVTRVGGPVPNGVVKLTSHPDPAAIQHGLDAGTTTLTGAESVNGHDTYHLYMATDGLTADLWVDATTYLPYRISSQK